MRKPFVDTVQEDKPSVEQSIEAAKSLQQGTYESRKVSLLDRLKGPDPVKPKNETPEGDTSDKDFKERKPDTETDAVPGSENNADGKAADTFEDFEEKVYNKLNDTDAIEIAEMIVQVGNIGRMVFIPGMYEGFMFPGQERNDVRDVVRRSIDNEQKNLAADNGFNNYEKRLLGKWGKLQEAIQNVSYTEPEIKTFAKYLAREISDMTVSVWMQKHMWLLYWVYLESKHAKNIIGGRANDFFMKKFGNK